MTSATPAVSTPEDGSPEPSTSSLIPVSRSAGRLGRYQLSLELARGGMATVHLARVDGRAGVHRFVAIKVLHPHLTEDPEFIEMFLDEARIASRVQHANLCGVIDFDAADSAHYLVMEYLAGEPLSAVFRAMGRRARGSPAERAARVARIIADACEGLHAAHELTGDDGEPLGVVHRDISPENVFLTYDGVAKVVDFGVATASIQKHHTRTGVLKGKYAYMAPEVLRGRRPDRRADIWSLGVVLWELLALKRLFHRSTDISTLKSVSELRIQPPSRVRPGVPAYYDAIVLKALARDPDERYQTARELGRDLTQVLARRRIAVGLAELSEWMDELFPSGRACKRQLLEIASRIEETTCVREPAAPERRNATETFDDQPTRIRDSLAPTRTSALRRRSTDHHTRRSRPPALRTDRRPRRRRWVASAAAASLAIIAALAMFHPLTASPEIASAAESNHAAKPSPAATEPTRSAPPSTPLRVGKEPYVVEIEQHGETETDPSSLVLRIRPEAEREADDAARESGAGEATPRRATPSARRARSAAPTAAHEPAYYRPLEP